MKRIYRNEEICVGCGPLRTHCTTGHFCSKVQEKILVEAIKGE